MLKAKFRLESSNIHRSGEKDAFRINQGSFDMLTLHPELGLPSMSRTGFEPPLTDDEQAIGEAPHRFALDSLRPLGRELDRMSAENVIHILSKD